MNTQKIEELEEHGAEYRNQIKGYELENTNLYEQLEEYKEVARTLDDSLVRAIHKLKALQNAVMALEPFDHAFCTDFGTNFHGAEYECNFCDSVNEHKPDCFVTKLREMLKSQGVLNND